MRAILERNTDGMSLTFGCVDLRIIAETYVDR
jgi:hypothetical protein